MGFRRSLILDTGVRAVFHTVLLFSVYLLFAGHNAPGGGFIGGLVAGAAFMLRYVDGGVDDVRRSQPLPPDVMLGTGVVISIGTGMASWLAGGQFLESGYLELDVPVLGDVAVTSALPFDIGVYLVVVGLTLAVLSSLGAEETEGSAGDHSGAAASGDAGTAGRGR
jgi:multicomponent Na+:H+ antiporter subunit A